VNGPLIVVSGDASRTGSPRLLLSFLTWVRAEHPDTRVHLVLTGAGPLLGDFRRVAASTTVLAADRPGPAELLALATEELGRPTLANPVRTAAAKRRLRNLPPGATVLANGAASLRLLDALPAPRRVVGWIHELAVGLDRSLAGTDAHTLLRRPDRLLAVSPAVDAELASRGVPAGRSAVAAGWAPDPEATRDPESVRAELGLAPGTPLVGGCGQAGWRKGTDLFLALAQRLDPSVHLVWIGDEGAPGELRREVEARGLTERVHLLGERADAPRLIAGLDVFALTSREDPFPLVALEAAGAGVPTVSFDNGGWADLLHDAGLDPLVAPYLDLAGFARAVRALLHAPAERSAVGARLAAHVATHHTVACGAPVVWKALAKRA
jgi:glycosyltransferase involved in cell wall biosynthesis